MPSHADFARRFNLSPPRITQLVKAGMPTTSYTAAERWRKAQGKKRKPTNERKFAAEIQSGKKRGRPKNRKPIPKTGDTLLDALNAAIAVHERAYEMVEEAMAAGSDETVSIRLSVYNKAQDGRFAAEKAYREEQERRNILIPFAEATILFRKGFDYLLTRIRRMPSALAPQCNPNVPLMAFTVLEREIVSIVTEAQKQFAPDSPPIPAEPKPVYAQPTRTEQATPQ